MFGCDKVDLARVERAGDEEPASSLGGWGNFSMIGRPRVVEKGSQAWAVALEVGMGLYILGPAEWVIIDL